MSQPHESTPGHCPAEPNHDTRCSPKQTAAGRDHHQAQSREMTITEHDPEQREQAEA